MSDDDKMGKVIYLVGKRPPLEEMESYIKQLEKDVVALGNDIGLLCEVCDAAVQLMLTPQMRLLINRVDQGDIFGLHGRDHSERSYDLHVALLKYIKHGSGDDDDK